MAKRITYLCLLPLFIGGLVYIFFRKNGLLGISLHLLDVTPTFWTVLINSLPDFCWAFSLSNALYMFFAYYHFSRLGSTLLIALLITFSEIIQVFFPRHFTFDMVDFFVDLLSVFLAAICQRNSYENKKV